MIVLDLDDFYEGHTAWELLMELRGWFPKFRVTMFTIPGRCSRRFILNMQAQPWIDMVPHGWMHRTSTESAGWVEGQVEEFLRNISGMGLIQGFKAPGWQISDACYRVLADHGYWIADQEYNNDRRPKDVPYYLVDQPWKIHGHVGGRMDNRLSKLMPQLLVLPKDTDFQFVKDYVVWPK